MLVSHRKPLDNVERNTHGSHPVFQNEANLSLREVYPPMRISCKFGEASWCSLPLRGLKSKISLHVAVERMLNKSINQMHRVDTSIKQTVKQYNCLMKTFIVLKVFCNTFNEVIET